MIERLKCVVYYPLPLVRIPTGAWQACANGGSYKDEIVVQSDTVFIPELKNGLQEELPSPG